MIVCSWFLVVMMSVVATHAEINSSTAEPSTESEAAVSEPETIPRFEDVVVPPMTLLFVMLLSLCGLSIKTHQRAIRVKLISVWASIRGYKYGTLNKIRSVPSVQCHELRINDQKKAQYVDGEKKKLDEQDDSFFSEFDLEVLTSMITSHNRPMTLFRISFPAAISLALCPATLYMYTPLVQFMWPTDEFPEPPNINEAIACFLFPAGLVYATCFGFAFQQAVSKQHDIHAKVTAEISMIDHIATFTSMIKFPTQQMRTELYQCIKAEAIFMGLQLLGREPGDFVNSSEDDIKVKIWSVVDLLREVNTSKKNQVDRTMCVTILDHVCELNSICSDRMGITHTRIHPMQWAFLESLGFFSFIGILLVDAKSERLELFMCIITVLSISMLCYVVADLDDPFSGFFRVDVSVLWEAIFRLETMYQASNGSDGADCVTMAYPQRQLWSLIDPKDIRLRSGKNSRLNTKY